jgi:hypothetical protein
MNRKFDQLPANPQSVESVKAKLTHMYEVDQYMRNYLNTPTQNKYSDQEKQEFQQLFSIRFVALDRADTEQLRPL